MAKSLVKTIKRDYVAFMPKPDVPTVLQNLAIAFEHYNEHHPHSALKYQFPREFRQQQELLIQRWIWYPEIREQNQSVKPSSPPQKQNPSLCGARGFEQ